MIKLKIKYGNFIYNDTYTGLSEILYQDEPITMGGM